MPKESPKQVLLKVSFVNVPIAVPDVQAWRIVFVMVKTLLYVGDYFLTTSDT